MNFAKSLRVIQETQGRLEEKIEQIKDMVEGLVGEKQYARSDSETASLKND